MKTSHEDPPVDTLYPILTTLPHAGVGLCIAWLSDDRIVVDWGDKTLRIWNLTDRGHEGTPMVHQGYLRGVITTKDGRIISRSSGDQCLMVWNADTHELMDGPWSTEYGVPLCMALSRNEELLASCHEKGIVIWDMVGTMRFRNCIDCEFIEGRSDAHSACFSPDGGKIAVLVDCRMVVVLDVASGEVEQCVQDQEDVYTILSIVWSSEGILCGCSDYSIHCLEPSTGKIIGDPWMGHGDYVACLALSADGNYLASGSSLERVVHLWNVKDGKRLAPPLKHDSYVRAVAFSPSGEFVACTGSVGIDWGLTGLTLGVSQ